MATPTRQEARLKKASKKRASRHRVEIAREAGDLAFCVIEEYTAALREQVQTGAEALRREVHTNTHNRPVALEVIDRLERHVIRLAPPSVDWARAQLEDQRERRNRGRV